MRSNKKIFFSVLFLILVLIVLYNIKNTENFTIGALTQQQKLALKRKSTNHVAAKHAAATRAQSPPRPARPSSKRSVGNAAVGGAALVKPPRPGRGANTRSSSPARSSRSPSRARPSELGSPERPSGLGSPARSSRSLSPERSSGLNSNILLGGSPVARVPKFQTQREIAEKKAEQKAEQKALQHIAEIGISLGQNGFIGKDLKEAMKTAEEMVKTNTTLAAAYDQQKIKEYKRAYSKERKKAAALAFAPIAQREGDEIFRALDPKDAAKSIFGNPAYSQALKNYQKEENRMNENKRAQINEEERQKAIRRGHFSFANPNSLKAARVAGDSSIPSILQTTKSETTESETTESENNEFNF